MKTALLYAALFTILQPCNAEDLKLPSLTLTDGKTYEGVTLKKKNETQASLIHSSGIKTVALAELPEEVAEKLGYSREKAQALEKAQLEAEKERDAEVANALDFKGLRLRLPLNEVPALVDKTLWSYDDMDILLKRVDLRNPNTTLAFDADGEEERRKNGFTSDQASESHFKSRQLFTEKRLLFRHAQLFYDRCRRL